ncbi:WbqC family protein [Solibacillus sp. FSL W7-1324]|uniref:WbqC family protein n=1 Tax=Solibacillus sp. FSL W7-1324 TaxID=2921701 RepID=UPI0030FA4C55
MKDKIVSIHQSQYLPWAAYFKKIAFSDTFVILDNVQFQKNGVQNRNKIRNKNGEFWITLPVNNKLDEAINEKKVVSNKDILKNWKMIEQSYSKSPNWKQHKDALCEIYNQSYENLNDINMKLIRYFLDVLNIRTEILQASELGVAEKKGNLVLALCKKLSATVYLSGHGALNYLDINCFEQENMKVTFIKSESPVYTQPIEPFIPNLSIIDFVMNASKEEFESYFQG